MRYRGWLARPSGTPAGAVPEVEYVDEVRPLAAGDLVALYSDGLLGQTANGAGVGELAAAIARAREAHGSATEIVAELFKSVPDVADDRTLVVAVRAAASAAGNAANGPTVSAAGDAANAPHRPGTHGDPS